MELLPRGGFKIETADYGIIEGRFCTWSLKRFCDRVFKGSLQELFNGMSAGLSIEQMAVLLLCGIQYVKRDSSLIVDDAYEIIDDAGGFKAFAVLVNHAFNAEDDSKKKDENAGRLSVGQNY